MQAQETHVCRDRGCNDMLKRLGMREDVARDALNPGGPSGCLPLPL